MIDDGMFTRDSERGAREGMDFVEQGSYAMSPRPATARSALWVVP